MDSKNREEWTWLNRELECEDEAREKVIKEMRETQKASKAAIFALQRGDYDTANQKMTRALAVARAILPIIEERPQLRHGTFSNAIEEYVEARAFHFFLSSNGKLLPFKDLEGLATVEEYIGGISDLTGEMQRYAVIKATARDVAAVQRCRTLTDDIMECVMLMSLRNGNLRKKTDAIKYSLKRFESILYELSLVPEGKKFEMTNEENEPKRAKQSDDNDE